jgi:hypothetical protein
VLYILILQKNRSLIAQVVGKFSIIEAVGLKFFANFEGSISWMSAAVVKISVVQSLEREMCRITNAKVMVVVKRKKRPKIR